MTQRQLCLVLCGVFLDWCDLKWWQYSMVAFVQRVLSRVCARHWQQLMHGVGRIGAILSAFVGAHLLNLGWHIDRIFLMLMIPALLVMVCIVIKGMRYGKTKPEVQLQTKPCEPTRREK